MKVYIVTDGDYSDYHIVEVFTDEQKAKQYAALHNFDNVEEYEADIAKIDGAPKFYVNYLFNVNERGGFYREQKNYSLNKQNAVVKCLFGEIRIYLSLEMEDDEKARKIAQDMYAKWKSEQSGV